MKKYIYTLVLFVATAITILADSVGDIALSRRNAGNTRYETYYLTVPLSAGYLRFSGTTPSWRTYAEVLSDLGAATTTQLDDYILETNLNTSEELMELLGDEVGTGMGKAIFVSGTPADGKYPRYNTDTTITWETVSGSGDMLLGTIQTVTAAKTFNVGTLLLDDSDSAFNLILGSTSTVTSANKKLTFDVNDADRTLTIGSSTTLSGGTHSGNNSGDVTLAGENYLGVAGQVITAASINLSGTHVTNTLPVAKGGTGLTAGTSGGILGYTAAGTLASSGALGAGDIVIGGGAGAVPTSLSAGATTEILVGGGAATAPVWTTASGSGAPLRQTSPSVTTSIDTASATFTAFAGATTLMTIGGTGAAASSFYPSTLDATSSTTGAIRTSGGISAAKAGNIGTTLTVGTGVDVGNADTSITRSGAGVIAVEGVDVSTSSNTIAFTNKTLDASATGNVVKMFGYLVLTHPHVFGAGVTQQTTVTNNQYGQALFGNATDKATNYVEYYLVIPPDVDTAIDLTATFKFQLSAGDTGDHEYEISFDDVPDSSAYAGTVATPISLAYTADNPGGAANDVETAGETTLTGWRSAMVAGRLMVIRLARDGDHASDTSTVNSYSGPLVIKYPITQ